MESDPKPGPCPICGLPGKLVWRPFCSKHCSDADLGRWLTGSYALPGEPADPDEPPENGEDRIVH